MSGKLKLGALCRRQTNPEHAPSIGMEVARGRFLVPPTQRHGCAVFHRDPLRRWIELLRFKTRGTVRCHQNPPDSL